MKLLRRAPAVAGAQDKELFKKGFGPFLRREIFMKSTGFIFLALFCGFQSAFAGEIAITFDDAPTPDSEVMGGDKRTDLLITSLQKANVKDAVFFVTAKNINDRSSNRLKRYESAGFHLGNHSYSHKSANKITIDNFLVDVYKAHIKIKQHKNFVPFFRFPYLHEGNSIEDHDRLVNEIESIGLKNGYVTVDNYDWYINAKYVEAVSSQKNVNIDNLRKLYVDTIWDCIKFYDDVAVKHLGKSPKHVLLLHENDTSAMFIGDLVNRIRSEGWDIISPQKAYKDRFLAQGSEQLSFNKQGRVAAIAQAKGVSTSKLRHPSENQDYIDQLFVKYEVIE